MNDKWDLGYLYEGFDDERFLSDLDSLKGDGEKLKFLLADKTVPEVKKMEMLVDESEKLSAKLDRLGTFIGCTLAVDATNDKANRANDRMNMIYTELQPVFSGIERFVAGVKDLDKAIAESKALGKVGFALREIRENAKHLIPEEIEPWILEMQLSGGSAFSQLRDKLDSTLSVDYRDEKLPLSAVRGKA